jgi:hypothetical protein
VLVQTCCRCDHRSGALVCEPDLHGRLGCFHNSGRARGTNCAIACRGLYRFSYRRPQSVTEATQSPQSRYWKYRTSMLGGEQEAKQVRVARSDDSYIRGLSHHHKQPHVVQAFKVLIKPEFLLLPQEEYGHAAHASRSEFGT